MAIHTSIQLARSFYHQTPSEQTRNRVMRLNQFLPGLGPKGGGRWWRWEEVGEGEWGNRTGGVGMMRRQVAKFYRCTHPSLPPPSTSTPIPYRPSPSIKSKGLTKDDKNLTLHSEGTTVIGSYARAIAAFRESCLCWRNKLLGISQSSARCSSRRGGSS